MYSYSNKDTELPEPLDDESLKKFAAELGLLTTPDQLELIAALDRTRRELAKNIIDHGKEGLVLMGP